VAAEGILKCYAKIEPRGDVGAEIETPKASRGRRYREVWGSVVSSPSGVPKMDFMHI